VPDKCFADFQRIGYPDLHRAAPPQHACPLLQDLDVVVPRHVLQHMTGVNEIEAFVVERKPLADIGDHVRRALHDIDADKPLQRAGAGSKLQTLHSMTPNLASICARSLAGTAPTVRPFKVCH